MNSENKNLQYYCKAPYGIHLQQDNEGDWVARVEELAGCTAHGRTPAEAVERLDEVKRAWIEDAIAAGDAIPLPREQDDVFSGKWLQRVPRSLHKNLSQMAEKEGASLNQFVTSILSEALGRRMVSMSESYLGPHIMTVPIAHNPIVNKWKLIRHAKHEMQGEDLCVWFVDGKKPQKINIIDALISPVSSLPDIMEETDFRINDLASKKDFAFKE
jgi:antitoxin HicB